MDVEIGIPQTPVTLVPGVVSRLGIEVANRSGAARSVRLGVSRSRGGAWAEIDDPVVELAPGEQRRVAVVFKPPANVLPTSTLMPFTVHAEELPYGVPAGRATGLLTVAAPERIDAAVALSSARRRSARYTATVTNRADASLTVGFTARIHPPGGRVDVDPAVVDVPGEGSATANVRVRPRRLFIGVAKPYVVSVTCRDASADDMPPLATVEADGVAKPRMRRGLATGLAVALLLVATAAVLVLTGRVDVPGGWRPFGPGGSGGSGGSGGAAGPGGPGGPARSAVEVRRPYALIDVFPQKGGAGLAAAEAARARLSAAGVPVRLVDSTATDQVADGPGGLWVLLQDGMPTVDEARAFCERYRPAAPKCDVVP
jgi:hypothetical protein